MCPERYCPIPFNLEEKNRLNGVNTLDQVLAKQKSTFRKRWARAYPPDRVSSVGVIHRQRDLTCSAFFPLALEVFAPRREFSEAANGV